MSVVHRTLVTSREYPRPRSHVFAAWADAEVKRQWFDLSDGPGEWRSDFRVGGAESYRSPDGASPRTAYDARHCDIVPDERIVLTSEITVDGRRASLTLLTAELEDTATGTLLRITEQVTLLDGLEDPDSRTRGTSTQLDRLAALLTTT